MPIYSTLMNIRLIMFCSLKLYHILVKVPKSCQQGGGKYSRGGITFICLVEDKQHLQARHLLPLSPADKKTFGLTVHELIQPWPGSDKGQGAAQRVKISQKHVEINHSSCYRSARQENTKPHTFFVSQHGLFPHIISTAIGGCKGWRMGIQGVMQILQDGDHSTLRMWIFIKGWSCVKKLMVINAHCQSWIQTLFPKSVLAWSLQIILRFHECWYLN